MSMIDFVVRTSAGDFQRGVMGSDAGQPNVILADGASISLNVYPGQIVSYVRQGQALVVTLANGEVLTIEGFFDTSGVAQGDLLVSAGGELYAVELVPGEGNILYASYDDAGDFGKFNPVDDFFFLRGPELLVDEAAVAATEDDGGVGMLLNPLIGGLGMIGPLGLGAGAVGAAVLASTASRGEEDNGTDAEPEPAVEGSEETREEGEGGTSTDSSSTGGGGSTDGGGSTGGGGSTDGGGSTGGGGGGQITDAPVVEIREGVQSVGYVVNGEDISDGVTISGTGTVGGAITVTILEVTETTTVDEEGNWTVTFEPGALPDGDYETGVDVVITNEGGTGTDTDVVEIDTEASVTFSESTTEGDGNVSAVEASDGIILTGTVEAGSTVIVTVYGSEYTATVTGESWSVTVPASDVTGGTYDLEVTVNATDSVGNTASTSGTVHVDTETSVTINTAIIGGDGTVNAAEHGGGTAVTGTAEAGASVVVAIGSASHTVTAGGDGSWSATFSSAELAEGDYTATVTATATDALGNTASTSGTFEVDTEVSVAFSDAPVEGDGIVNAAEAQDGVVLSGTTDPGASVDVTLGGTTVAANVTASGAWTASFAAGAIPTGETSLTATATATDAAGNSASDTMPVEVDTVTSVTVETATVEGDGVVNFVERSDGITLTGTAEAGVRVDVTFNGHTNTVTAAGNGSWSTDFGRSTIPQGESVQTVTAKATDLAGNTATATGQLVVDTVVEPLTGADDVTADNTLNAAEAAAGITLTGTVEVGATVEVEFEGLRRDAIVDGSGNWSVDYGAPEIPAGTYDAAVRIHATDQAGNERLITDTFHVDTVAPDVPLVSSTDRGVGSLRSVGISGTDEGLEVTELASDGTSQDLAIDAVPDTRFPETDLYFDTAVPDGSQLVISSTDEAGNQNATLFVLDEAGSNLVDIAHPGLGEFDVGSIDLNFALDSELTLSAADLEGLSANDNSLTIHGGSDDTVTMSGAAATGDTEEIGGRTYDVYTLGDEGGRVIVDEDITIVT
ncbi:BapA prefix-like domain-containing protein [Roseisalinus antarcticus]|uniref:Biofilm-associated protein BapA-like prefix-like domain-containing protein n=1 Tax=Roseisalinus antarcticus TaxID=254357 RepID=A0A1Y5SGE0_9RHOB|nr:BapA prefix-like domain-containing protein [Roseisalinus antarcticus]SLN39522.1 hypothetical protein ROA7023_01515 [Roseisalinus antarcticus]